MFRHKYLKYKKKYLDLKNSNLKGGGEQPIENSSTPIEDNNLIGYTENYLIRHIDRGMAIDQFDRIINGSSNLNNLVGALEYFTLLNDDDFKNKFRFLKIIIEKIIKDETINKIENNQIKKTIKGLLETLGGIIDNLRSSIGVKINNVQNSMTMKIYRKEYWPLYNDINNYFKRTYNYYLKDDNKNISSISSSSSSKNSSSVNPKISSSSSSSSSKKKNRYEVLGYNPFWRRKRKEEIVSDKRKHSKEEYSIPEEELKEIKEWKKKKEQKLNEDQEQTQIEFKPTIVEK